MVSENVIERIARHYPSRWTQGYVRGKMRSDPAYKVVLEQVMDSDLPLMDVGCGMGFLSFYLREMGYARPIIGFDLDATKIGQAREVADHYKNLEFRVEDAGNRFEFQGNVVMLDVLQYLDLDTQRGLLQRLATNIAPGGKCLIRATPNDGSWRYLITKWMDGVMHAIRWMKSPAQHYLTMVELTAPFVAAGCKCKVRPLWGATPFNSYFIVVERRKEP